MNDFPRIKWNHEWVAVDLGNNRGLSSSYGGTKARGYVPQFLFDAWSELGGTVENAAMPLHVRTLLNEAKGSGPTNKDKVEAFVARIPAMWPEWDVPPRTYTVGQPVTYKGVEGKVLEFKGKKIICEFTDGSLVGFAADLLDKYNGGR